jgi:hypothetical protein
VLDLGEAELFEQWRQVPPEPAAQALLQSVPAADRVRSSIARAFVAELHRADLTDDRRRVDLVVARHRVRRRPGRRLQLPWIVFRARAAQATTFSKWGSGEQLPLRAYAFS